MMLFPTRNLAILSAYHGLTRWYHKNGSAHIDSVQFCRFLEKTPSNLGLTVYACGCNSIQAPLQGRVRYHFIVYPQTLVEVST